MGFSAAGVNFVTYLHRGGRGNRGERCNGKRPKNRELLHVRTLPVGDSGFPNPTCNRWRSIAKFERPADESSSHKTTIRFIATTALYPRITASSDQLSAGSLSPAEADLADHNEAIDTVASRSKGHRRQTGCRSATPVIAPRSIGFGHWGENSTSLERLPIRHARLTQYGWPAAED